MANIANSDYIKWNDNAKTMKTAQSPTVGDVDGENHRMERCGSRYDAIYNHIEDAVVSPIEIEIPKTNVDDYYTRNQIVFHEEKMCFSTSSQQPCRCRVYLVRALKPLSLYYTHRVAIVDSVLLLLLLDNVVVTIVIIDGSFKYFNYCLRLEKLSSMSFQCQSAQFSLFRRLPPPATIVRFFSPRTSRAPFFAEYILIFFFLIFIHSMAARYCMPINDTRFIHTRTQKDVVGAAIIGRIVVATTTTAVAAAWLRVHSMNGYNITLQSM